jgi:hypothetical protein
MSMWGKYRSLFDTVVLPFDHRTNRRRGRHQAVAVPMNPALSARVVGYQSGPPRRELAS